MIKQSFSHLVCHLLICILCSNKAASKAITIMWILLSTLSHSSSHGTLTGHAKFLLLVKKGSKQVFVVSNKKKGSKQVSAHDFWDSLNFVLLLNAILTVPVMCHSHWVSLWCQHTPAIFIIRLMNIHHQWIN